MFQGGFTSRTVRINFWKNEQKSCDSVDIHPEDTNSIQSFAIKEVECDSMRLDFIDFNDFYGRIVIYKLDILGENKTS